MFLSCLISCGKNDDVEDSSEAEKVQVLFSVKTLAVDVQPMDSPQLKSLDMRAATNSILTNIYYSLKNTTTGKWYFGEQVLGTAGYDFGNIDLWIPSGTYNATFFGYGVDNSNGNASMYVDKDYNKIYIRLANKDSFVKNFQVTTTSSDNQVEVDLSRLSSKLVVKLNDVIPSEIKKIKVRLPYYPLYDVINGYATYEGSSGNSLIMEHFLTIQDAAVDEFEFYLLPQTERTLTLSIYDDSGAELGSTNIGVSFYQNKRTIVQGNILDVINQKPFHVTVSNEWDSDVIVPIQ